MASNLRVDSIVPATGANVSIGTATGGVNIPGVLTYEDVTNVDSVGVITARSGVNVSGGEVKVGTAVTVSSGGVITSGIVTATNVSAASSVTAATFHGSGANLTSLPASGLFSSYALIEDQKGAGANAGFADAEYKAAGVKVMASSSDLIKNSEALIKVNQPTTAEIKKFKAGQILITFIWPAQNPQLVKDLNKKKITSLSMDMIPRISRAQKMDALSSMANIAGYRAVIEAANNFGRFFTGQITAAGRVPPAKVLVIGAGVAGLAAIGAAQGLGAVVRAFDVRPEVAEQIESMGGEFLFLDFDESSSTDGGYAAPSSPEFRKKQLECFREQAPDIDILITTALIPGRDAPKLWLKDMVAKMKPGSVIVDLAAEKGGNCDLTKADKKVVTKNGVTIIGYTDFPRSMAKQSSSLYANNV